MKTYNDAKANRNGMNTVAEPQPINPVDAMAMKTVERAIRSAVKASVAADARARIIADRADMAVRLALASFGIVYDN